MKIIDILNKIANGEEPPKKILIRFKDIEERIVGEETFEYAEKFKDYFDEHDDRLFEDYDWIEILNDEPEILETTITYKPDKIEKLEIVQEKNCKNNWKWKLKIYNISTPQKIMGDKINEIIEVLNER